jgi:hypothetical protein
MERGLVQSGFWWGEMRERNHLEHLGVDGRIILKWILSSVTGGGKGVWSGLIWLRIETGGGLL